MSTANGPNQKPPESSLPATKPIAEILERGADATPPLPVDESAAALETRLQKEIDGRQDDKFWAFFIGTILIDIATFQHMPWVGIVCVFLLELVGLLGLAKRYGNEFATIMLAHIFQHFFEWIKKDKD